ncbi:MAG: 5-formyltetrahydrofolate cyclo-ligase [Alphaproteobacteria bacterium]
MSPDDEKARLRTEARALRRAAFEAAGATAASAIAKHGMDFLGSVEGRVVAGYMAHGSEVDLGPLLAALADAGATLALPVVRAANVALTFRAWLPGDPLIEGAYGIGAPDDTALEVTPDIVLVPLLAFDADGHRLGQGGGFYDRTLENLRRHGDVTAIGVAFAAQRVSTIPRIEHDQRLDGVITEDGTIKT